MRALVKSDRRIRLVCNFISSHDLVEKDPYELAHIRYVIRVTQESKWFTVIDFKEALSYRD